MFNILSFNENLFCQDLPVEFDPTPLNKLNYDQVNKLLSHEGRPFQGDNTDVVGTPYYYDDFASATLTLASGKKYDSVSIKLDVVNHELHYKSASQNRQIVLKDGLVKEFVFTDFIKEILGEKFRCGYPVSR